MSALLAKRPSAINQPSTAAKAVPGKVLTASTQHREFEFTDRDFDKIRKLIYAHAGISLSDQKADMVYSRLARRLRHYGDRKFSDYLSRLENSGEDEWELFVNALTTNLTSFFREAHHFDVLAQYLRKLQHRPIRIWCSAASTGEEPYSIAMSVCETFGTLTPPVSIVASDIDTNCLNTAKQGVYASERVEKLSKERLQQFFLKGTGGKEGYVRIRPELRKLIEYKRINLLDARYDVSGPFDVIFCRNVMIYFDKPTQYAILKRFHPLLNRDGLLLAGHSESFMHAADLFKTQGKTVYVRTDSQR